MSPKYRLPAEEGGGEGRRPGVEPAPRESIEANQPDLEGEEVDQVPGGGQIKVEVIFQALFEGARQQ